MLLLQLLPLLGRDDVPNNKMFGLLGKPESPESHLINFEGEFREMFLGTLRLPAAVEEWWWQFKKRERGGGGGGVEQVIESVLS